MFRFIILFITLLCVGCTSHIATTSTPRVESYSSQVETPTSQDPCDGPDRIHGLTTTGVVDSAGVTWYCN